MKRLVLVVVLASLAIAGCGSGGGGVAEPASTMSEPGSASPSPSASTTTKTDEAPANADRHFWVVYGSSVAKSDRLPKANAIRAAKAVCQLLDGGWNRDDFGDAGYLNDDSEVILIGTAVSAYCPKYKASLLKG